MVLTINGKECNVHFGIKFIRELDKKNFLEKDGVRFGAGLELKAPPLHSYDTVALSEILHAGTCCMEKGRPSVDDIDRYVENYDKLEELFDEVLSELKKGNATKLKMKQLEENIEGKTKK